MAIEIESKDAGWNSAQTFDHEKLDAGRAAIGSVGWPYRQCKTLKGQRNVEDRLPRASQAMALKIAEANGQATNGDRRR